MLHYINSIYYCKGPALVKNDLILSYALSLIKNSHHDLSTQQVKERAKMIIDASVVFADELIKKVDWPVKNNGNKKQIKENNEIIMLFSTAIIENAHSDLSASHAKDHSIQVIEMAKIFTDEYITRCKW